MSNRFIGNLILPYLIDFIQFNKRWNLRHIFIDLIDIISFHSIEFYFMCLLNMLCYVVAGGCNCSRSNLTGALLGAYFGLRHPNSSENEKGNSNNS